MELTNALVTERGRPELKSYLLAVMHRQTALKAAEKEWLIERMDRPQVDWLREPVFLRLRQDLAV